VRSIPTPFSSRSRRSRRRIRRPRCTAARTLPERIPALPPVHIGTSGWHYRSWVDAFYPAGTRPADFLTHYSRHFSSVEINATFYRLPTEAAVAGWRDTVAKSFLFACKASRFITHMKKLRDPGGSFARFFDRVAILGPGLGPILCQLPPGWRIDLERLQAFLDAVPTDVRCAFEFRNDSWLVPETLALLRARGAALCISDIDGRCSPIEVTADFAYVRLHGPGPRYRGSYDDEALYRWTERLLTWRREGVEGFCFFDNDEKGFAAADALRLQDILAAGGLG